MTFFTILLQRFHFLSHAPSICYAVKPSTAYRLRPARYQNRNQSSGIRTSTCATNGRNFGNSRYSFSALLAPPTSTDTLLILNGKPYQLRMQSELDSTQHLTTMVKADPGHSDTIRGYEGRFTFTLRDSLNRTVFRRQLHKADFYKRIGAEVVVQSGADAPAFLGYSAPFEALVFTLGFAVPDTDWGSEAVLLLDLKGQVIRMANGNNYGGGPESFPTLSKDGYTLLTEDEVLRASRPTIPLEKPHAELRGAFFLSDTALVTRLVAR